MAGRNLRCSYRQNWQLSLWPKDHLPKKLHKVLGETSPEPICPQLESLDTEVPGEGGENTYCFQCGALLIERFGFFVRQNRIRDGACPNCGTVIDGIGMSGS